MSDRPIPYRLGPAAFGVPRNPPGTPNRTRFEETDDSRLLAVPPPVYGTSDAYDPEAFLRTARAATRPLRSGLVSLRPPPPRPLAEAHEDVARLGWPEGGWLE